MSGQSSAVKRPIHEDKEDEQHARAIQRLAQELHMPAEEIRPSYMETLAAFKRDAKIRAFLPVLVSRSVKEQLQQR